MNELIKEILIHDGPATIVTNGAEGPHVTATWNSYIVLDENGNLLIPAGGFRQTEENSKSGKNVTVLIASKRVKGKQGMGAGIRLTGKADFYDKGIHFERTKDRFVWARAVLVFSIEKIEQIQ